MGLFFEHDTEDMHDYFPGSFVHGDDVYLDDDHMDEKWWYADDVPGYMVSNCGRVWSEKSHKFLKMKRLDDHGHKGVAMSINGKVLYRYIQRLVAKAFIPNTNNAPVVRHLDDDPDNNFVYNLAWGTQRENALDALQNGRTFVAAPEVRARVALEQSTPIVCTNLKSGEKTEYSGQNAAARCLGLQQANIWKVLNKQRPQTCGYYFEYLREDE